MMMSIMRILLFLFLLHASWAEAQNLIPLPSQISYPEKSGFYVWPRNASARVEGTDDPLAQKVINTFIGELSKKVPVYKEALVAYFDPKIANEGYELEVAENGIRIRAGSTSGFFYATQTLRQLRNIAATGLISYPYISIKDQPRFRWRGMHLDVSRHFFTVDEVKQYIDLMAQFKLNVFHWHLTDDQGWRIEIKKYPLLTQVGAWRVDKNSLVWGVRPQAKPTEQPTYGGFYTQQQIKDVVAYAADRAITIIPEIEMPGHSAAAIAAYPQLSCTKKPQLPLTGGNYEGIASNFCAADDSVKVFLTDVLREVLELFPSKYIHVGGDEVDKTAWNNCEKCKAYCKTKKIPDMLSLQSDFMKYFDTWLTKRKRIMIGWDEILEGGLAPAATVMSWRGVQGGIDAATMGHDVVMSPGKPCYFDHYQAEPSFEPIAIGGLNTLKDVYAFDPIPNDMDLKFRKHILGGQGNMWTEFMTHFKHVQYMLLPRMPALAEALWTKSELKNWDGFAKRLKPFKEQWSRDSIAFGPEHRGIRFSVIKKDGNAYIQMGGEVTDASIVYTTNQENPTATDSIYQNPIPLRSNLEVRAQWTRSDSLIYPSPISQTFIYHHGVEANVIWENGPSSKYPAEGLNSIANGIKGDLTLAKSWMGVEGTNMSFVLEWQEPRFMSTVEMRYFHAPKSWIFLPDSASVYGSADGKTFKLLATVPVGTLGQPEEAKAIRNAVAAFTGQYLRKIRVVTHSILKCPKGHVAEGEKAWVFIDECQVK
ncbi:MAG: beta-N-acetylhexosaminidase [Bacteroidota bacterium]